MLPPEYTLIIEVVGQGTLTPSAGTYTYTEVTTVEIEAEPAQGWQFYIWEGDAAEPFNPRTTVNVDDDKFVRAYFEEIPKSEYTLTVLTKREGEDGARNTVTPAPGSHIYKQGERVEFEAIPGTGWSFSHWEGDLEGVEPKKSLVINGNKEVTAVFSFFDGGGGGDSNPFLIATPGQFHNIRNHITGAEIRYFKIVADINLEAYKESGGWTPIGAREEGRSIPFTGYIDGNGYAITNLYIDRPSSDEVGLFAHLANNGHLHGLVLKNVELVRGSANVGALAGINDGKITNCYASGVIETRFGGYVGGLVGRNNGRIETSYSNGDVSGVWDIGGLVGINYGTVERSYALGKVKGRGSNTGGLVGRNEGAVRFTYAAGSVEGERTVGGLVGTNQTGEVRDSYYDKEKTGQSDRGKGEPKETAEMKARSTFRDWDFQSIWSIQEGETYPYLRWTVF